MPDRRHSAAIYLAPIGPQARKAIPALIAALQAQLKSNDHEYGWVANALGMIAPGTEFADRAIAVLVEALQSKDSDTRSKAAERLGRFGPMAKIAIPILKNWTQDPETSARFNQQARQAARKVRPGDRTPWSARHVAQAWLLSRVRCLVALEEPLRLVDITEDVPVIIHLHHGKVILHLAAGVGQHCLGLGVADLSGDCHENAEKRGSGFLHPSQLDDKTASNRSVPSLAQ